jgi:hypothetical protein
MQFKVTFGFALYQFINCSHTRRPHGYGLACLLAWTFQTLHRRPDIRSDRVRHTYADAKLLTSHATKRLGSDCSPTMVSITPVDRCALPVTSQQDCYVARYFASIAFTPGS